MSTKKNHSHATPLRACEVPQPRNKKKAKSVHEKELAEIAREAFYEDPDFPWKWNLLDENDKLIWRRSVRAVLDEAMFRLEAKFNKK